MAGPEQERMDVISKALANIVRQQQLLDQRLARVEAALGVEAVPPQAEPPLANAPPVPPPAVPAPTVVPPAVATPAPVLTEPSAPPPPRPANSGSRRLETSIGLTLINRIGVITLVLGIGFFFKWAVDSQWIGPAGRVALGILAGFLAIGGADLVWRRGQKVFAQGITATGICILYLAIYAAFGFYALVSQPLDFFAMTVITALAGVLALRYQAPAIAALGLFGGFLTPVLLSTGEDHPWFLLGYILILDLGALVLAKAPDFELLQVVSTVGTILLAGAWMFRFQPVDQVPGTLFFVFYLALYAAFASLLPVFLAAQCFTAVGIAIVSDGAPGVFCVLSLLAAVAGLYIADRRRWTAAAGTAAAAFWLVSASYGTSPPSPPAVGTMFAAYTAGFFLFLLWTPWWLLVRRLPVGPLHLTLSVVNAAAYFGASYARLHLRYHAWLGLFAMAIAAIHLVLAYELWRRQPANSRDTIPVLLNAGIALALLTVAVPVQFAAYRVTVAWALEAAAFSWIAARLRNRWMVWATAVVFLLVCLRLLGIDAWTDARFARLFTFAVSAVCLWLAAKWVVEPPALRLVYYVTGHLFTLWVLTQEVLAWAVRNAGPGTLLSLETFSVSILYACYAVLFVAIGVATRSTVNRLAGLLLICVVVLKLYLFDVWQLGRYYRTLAFVGLGLLLLSTSFLYSHFRALIESWWKNDG